MLNTTNQLSRDSQITFPIVTLTTREAETHARAIERATSFLTKEAELIEVIEQVDRLGYYTKLGYKRTIQYCVKALGLSPNIASTYRRIAVKSREVTELLPSLKTRKLTASVARQMLTVITNENFGEWLEKAQRLSKHELEREVVRIDPKAATKERITAVAPDRYLLEVGLSEKLRRDLERAQDLCSQSQRLSASLEVTLVALTSFYLQRKDPVEKAKRAQNGCPHPIAAQTETAAQIQPAKQSQPAPQSLPATQPTKQTRKPLPAAVRHAVHARDQGRCQALTPSGPCHETRWIDLHHVKEHARGGEDTPENLTTLCSSHHKLWHQWKTASRDADYSPVNGIERSFFQGPPSYSQ